MISILIEFSKFQEFLLWAGNTQQRKMENQECPREESASLVTCEICTDLITLPNKLFNNQNKCAHPFCESCIIEYVDLELKCGISQIKCPAPDCKHHLEPLCCRPIIPRLVFDKWCDLLCESSVLEIDKCYCPNRKCSVMILNECGGSASKSTCPKCKELFCFSCRVAWHAGRSCKKGRELRDGNDIAFGVLAKKNKWQRCPSCHHCVELTDGCSIVTCRYALYIQAIVPWITILRGEPCIYIYICLFFSI